MLVMFEFMRFTFQLINRPFMYVYAEHCSYCITYMLILTYVEFLLALRRSFYRINSAVEIGDFNGGYS